MQKCYKVALLLWKEQNTEGPVVIGGGRRRVGRMRCWAERSWTANTGSSVHCLQTHITTSLQPLCELSVPTARGIKREIRFPETCSQGASAGFAGLWESCAHPCPCVTTVCSQCRWCVEMRLQISSNGTMRTLGPRVLIWPFKK